MPRSDVVIPVIALGAVLVVMLGELILSRSHEHALRARGATEPPGDVYRALAWTYPMMFVVMAAEGAVIGPAPQAAIVLGALIFIAAKALKFWAISTLGPRWTFRILVPPDAPLVTGGPYTWLRHPNYVAVFGEIAGVAILVGAPVSGVLSLISFGVLVRKRISVEEKALGILSSP